MSLLDLKSDCAVVPPNWPEQKIRVLYTYIGSFEKQVHLILLNKELLRIFMCHLNL